MNLMVEVNSPAKSLLLETLLQNQICSSKTASTQNKNVSIIKLSCAEFHCVQSNKRVWKKFLVLIV